MTFSKITCNLGHKRMSKVVMCGDETLQSTLLIGGWQFFLVIKVDKLQNIDRNMKHRVDENH